MSQLSPLFVFRNAKYQVLVRIHGISISKTFTKKIHAQKWAKSTEVTIESGQYSESLGLTIKDALAEYQQSKLSHDKRSDPHIKNAMRGSGKFKADSPFWAGSNP